MKQTRPFCLASGSPRRRQLLTQFGLDFSLCEVNVDEARLPEEAAADYALRLSITKARAALGSFGEHIILAGDTVVALEGEILGKPNDTREAAAMIARLSGKTHRVLSAYTLLDALSGEHCTGVPVTEVTFRELPPEWIDWYSRLPEAADKAGAYAIQGVGGAMVRSIAGSYNAVVGFPMEEIIWNLVRKGWLNL